MVEKLFTTEVKYKLGIVALIVLMIVAMMCLAYYFGNVELRQQCASIGGRLVYSDGLLPKPLVCMVVQ